jgi:hypothetical protein
MLTVWKMVYRRFAGVGPHPRRFELVEETFAPGMTVSLWLANTALRQTSCSRDADWWRKAA